MPKKVLIVGAGLAGCQVAYQIKKSALDIEIVVLCKAKPHNCNSWLAQGGIACAIDPSDHWLNHLTDTLKAGVFHNHLDHTETLVSQGPDILHTLINEGLTFDKTDQGAFQFGLEGAHDKERILHCGGDQTGRLMTQFFHQQLQDITWLEQAQVTELLVADGTCYGLKYLDAQEVLQILEADAVVLATGGIGGLYPISTNDFTISGDGVGLACRHQVALRDMEFMQFHPTLLTAAGKCYGLISEAVRGAGGYLEDEQGQKIMTPDVHPLTDLAPRDVVARKLTECYQKGQQVYLNISKVVDFEQHFPQITANLDQHQIPFRQSQKIPVRPGAHFMMGGIKANDRGQTSLKRLYAVGEAACTGVHGANRLASNSLLECLVFGQLTAQDILTLPAKTPWQKATPARTKSRRVALALPDKATLQNKAWQAIGIQRSETDLLAFLDWLSQFQYQYLPQSYSKAEVEIANLCLTAQAVAQAAFERPVSLGAHARIEKQQDPRKDVPVESLTH